MACAYSTLAPFGEGAAMGLFNAVAAIASALGAIAGGKVADVFGYLRSACSPRSVCCLPWRV
jgi:predicted MFS family arabinose efflux permease